MLEPRRVIHTGFTRRLAEYHVVDESVTGVEQTAPDICREERWEGVRQDHDRAVDLLTLHAVVVEEKGDTQTDNEGAQHCRAGEDEGPRNDLQQRRTKTFVGEDLLEVFETNLYAPTDRAGLFAIGVCDFVAVHVEAEVAVFSCVEHVSV